MAHHKLREDNKCQNCGFIVRRRFCPKCGQENVETRQSFHYLFTHFIEDLVHYDGSFWKTLKYLMFHPGRLTKEYLEGKRKKFVPPVKLYIFVSFFVFFVGSFIGKFTSENTNNENTSIFENEKATDYGLIRITPPQEYNDSLSATIEKENKIILSRKEYDSIQLTLPENKRDSGILKIINQKLSETDGKYTEKDFWIKIFDSFKSNFPKFLFFYMPVFAFFMWLFNSKKKWYYFDSGIFTLHYFAFLLLSFFIVISILGSIPTFFPNRYTSLTYLIFGISIMVWTFIYFFKALRKVYGYSRISTFFRGIFLLFVNMFFFIFGIVLYFFLIFFMI